MAIFAPTVPTKKKKSFMTGFLSVWCYRCEDLCSPCAGAESALVTGASATIWTQLHAFLRERGGIFGVLTLSDVSSDSEVRAPRRRMRSAEGLLRFL